MRLAVSLACGWLALTTPTSAQDTNAPFADVWRWTQFAAPSGLVRHRVRAIAETSNGDVWAQAGSELARFDGYVWTHVPASAGLPLHVTSLATVGASVYAVADRRLYVGDASGFSPVRGDAIERVAVKYVARLGGDRVLVNLEDGRLLSVRQGRVEPPGIVPAPSSRVDSLRSSRRGPFATTPDGLFRYADGRWEHILASHGKTPWLTMVAESANGHGLVSVDHPAEIRGVWQWTAGGRPVRARGLPQSPPVAGDSRDDGAVIVFLSNGQAWWRQSGTWGEVRGLPPELADAVHAEFRTNGDAWVATESGLWLYRGSSRRWTTLRWSASREFDQVNALVRARDGTLWAGTAGGVVGLRPDGTRVVTRLSTAMVVTGLAQAPDGVLWAGSGYSFTGVAALRGTTWQPQVTGTELDGSYVHRIHVDRQGRLWFLTLGASSATTGDTSRMAGVFVLENGRIGAWSEGAPLRGRRVYDMTEDAAGGRWWATSTGVLRLRDGAWTQFDASHGMVRGRAFAVEAIGSRVYYGDQIFGLGVIEDDRVTILDSSHGLQSEAVQDLAGDPHGALWVTTQGGLIRYADGMFTVFDRLTGLSSARLWPLLVEPQRVLTGTMNAGVAVLALDEASAPSPRVDDIDAIVEGRSALVRWTAHSWWGEMPPDKVLTQARVDDGPWTPWSTKRELTLTNLSPGEHTVQIRASNPFGLIGDDAARVPVRVPLPFFRQPAFYVPVGSLLVLVAALLGALSVKARRHRETQRQLREQLRQTEKMDSIGRFAGGVAHDFNNLLTVIAGNAEMLEASAQEHEQDGSELRQIRLAAEQGTRLTRQLLAFARRQPIAPAVHGINDIVAGVESLLPSLLGETIQVRTVLAPDAGQVLADRGQIEAVLVNLAINARDAMPDGGRLTIETSDVVVTAADVREHVGAAAGPHVRLAVTDTGTGMDAMVMSHLFEPFYTTKAPGSGTGLGLASCYGIVKQAGGHIRVTSTPGQGSCFAIYLPRASATPSADASAVATQPRPRAARVLVVEDQEPVRQLMVRILKRGGYSVFEASDAVEALARVPDLAPLDLVVTDIVMPLMSGLEMAERLRADHPGITVLFVSGYPHADDANRADETLPHPMLAKPFTPQALLDRVAELIGERASAPR